MSSEDIFIELTRDGGGVTLHVPNEVQIDAKINMTSPSINLIYYYQINLICAKTEKFLYLTIDRVP
ncbi:MAG: hypothetical protein WA631_17965 [Nitrososphaeraceae archaeon]